MHSQPSWVRACSRCTPHASNWLFTVSTRPRYRASPNVSATRVRLHVLASPWDQPNPGLPLDPRLIIPTIVSLVRVDAGARRQPLHQLMYRRQIVAGGGQEVEGDRDALRGDDQVQPPAEELFLLRRAIAAILRPAHLAAAPRPCPPTNGQRHGVDDEDRAARERFAQEIEQDSQPVPKRVRATVEARDGERAGDLPRDTVLVVKQQPVRDRQFDDSTDTAVALSPVPTPDATACVPPHSVPPCSACPPRASGHRRS